VKLHRHRNEVEYQLSSGWALRRSVLSHLIEQGLRGARQVSIRMTALEVFLESQSSWGWWVYEGSEGFRPGAGVSMAPQLRAIFMSVLSVSFLIWPLWPFSFGSLTLLPAFAIVWPVFF